MTQDATPPEGARNTEADKVHWEVEKLKAETTSLSRATGRTGQSLVTILTALTAVLGVLIQYGRSNHEYQLAEIKREQALLDVAKLQHEKDSLNEYITSATGNLAALKTQREQAEAELKNAQTALAALETKLASAPPTAGSADTTQTLRDVKASIVQATDFNTKAKSLSEETGRHLEKFRAEMTRTNVAQRAQR